MSCIGWAARHLNRDEIEGKRVIEVGSLDVNGSLRCIVEMLRPREYVGVDIVPGPAVEVVCKAEQLEEKFGKESFDFVLCVNTLEHIRDWKKAVGNIKRICRPGGVMLFIIPAVWTYHGHPYDCWRVRKEDIADIFSDCQVQIAEEDNKPSAYTYAKIKKPAAFVEKDLSDYQLYSIVLNKRVKELRDKDFHTAYFFYLSAIDKFKSAGIKMFWFLNARI
jgi:SAM-dependent methyltransferase